MSVPMSKWLYVVQAGAILVAACTGCGKHSSPLAPSSAPGGPTLATIWPYADSSRWTFEMHSTQFAAPVAPAYAHRADLAPGAPLPEHVPALLDSLDGEPAVTPDIRALDVRPYTLQFAGDLITHSGSWGRRLLSSVGAASAVPSRPPSVGFGAAGIDSFSAAPFPPLLLRGPAWRSTRDAIFAYGNQDTFPSWTFLPSDMTPGTQFIQPIDRILPAGITLRGRILDRRTVTTPAGVFVNAVECAYVVNYGAYEIFNGGVSLGFVRLVSFGVVDYADGVGPVASREHQYALAVANGGATHGQTAQSTRLTSWGLPSRP